MSLPFRALGLGGGGMKGILLIGALRELSKHQELVFPDGVYGVSVGAIVGTYIAFGLPLDVDVGKIFRISSFIPEPDYSKLPEMLSLKGVFSMDTLEKTLIKIFLEKGVDLRTKVIGDAKMPLYIMASNLTKGKPTIFSENVPVLEALKCSCCIPGVFRPQILYNQVYVDGDIFVPSVDKFITSENVLCLSLKKQMSDYNFRPETIEEMSPIKYVHDIYTLVTQNFFNQVRKQCTLQLSYPGLRSMSDISELNVPDILETSGLSLSRFLRSKGRNKESPEV
jgi:predicted patatin/cPLA2 family phospholipase